MTVSAARHALDIDALRGRIDGRVIGPNDDDYDADRAVMYGGIDRHPAAIVRVASVADVRAVIAAARDGGLELAVRGGGHSNKGDSTTEGGIVLDLRDMAAIDIDLSTKTAWVEGGATALAVSEAAAKHGLALGFGWAWRSTSARCSTARRSRAPSSISAGRSATRSDSSASTRPGSCRESRSGRSGGSRFGSAPISFGGPISCRSPARAISRAVRPR